MIPARKLAALVRQNIRRNRKQFLLSAFGIVVGIATFAFFLALGLGVRRVVLGEIFPVDRVEIVPSRANLGAGRGLLLGGGGPVLDDAFVTALKQRPGVAEVYPKMKVAFPARGWGGHELLGLQHDLYFEVSGFADGVDPALVGTDDIRARFQFKDFEADARSPQACNRDADCPQELYCAWDVHQCHRPIPVLVSRYLLELYNGSIAPSHGLPKVTSFVASRFLGLTFTVELGVSYLGDRATRGPVGIQRRMQLVGISDKAIPLGITMPLGYVRRWNALFASDTAARQYSSIVVRVRDKSDLTPLASWVKQQGFDIADSAAEEIGLAITIVTLLFTFISFTVMAISAINIAHTFFMLISERRREIGVLRALGASRADVRRVVLAEATVVGLGGGVLGLLMGYLASLGVDLLSRTVIPDFPFKPTTYFQFTPALCAGSIVFAVVFCLLGALLPARRAAGLEPAAVLAAQ